MIDHGLYSSLLDGTQEYLQARPKLDAFIRKADAYFARAAPVLISMACGGWTRSWKC